MSENKDFDTRLMLLEEREKTNAKLVKTLKGNIDILLRDYLDIKTELTDAQSEIGALQEKIDNLETRTMEEGNDNTKQKVSLPSNIDKIDVLETRMVAIEKVTGDFVKAKDTKVKEIVISHVDKIDDLQKQIATVRKELLKCQNSNADTNQKVSNLSTKLDKINSLTKTVKKHHRKFKDSNRDTNQTVSNLSTKLDAVAQSVTHLSSLHKVMNRTLACRQGELDVRTKVDDMTQIVKSLEARQGHVAQSVTSVRLNKRGRNLSTSNLTRLDECVMVDVNRGLFDQTSCCVVPQCDGDYAAGVWYVQEGEGVIWMALNWDESGYDGGYTVGRTDGDWDVCYGVHCLHLKKGQRVWVTARRWEGEARIGACKLLFWLLG